MKQNVLLVALGVLLAAGTLSVCAAAQAVDYHGWEQILQAYVDANGRVDYARLGKNRASLDDFIRQEIETADISGLSGNAQKAFWINAYNVLTVRLIIDHYTPRLKGIRSINWGRPWDIPLKAAGRQISLNDIEHKILRQWDPPDARIHFALNCASIGCPKLPRAHFDPERLDEQLEQETIHFMNDPTKVRLDRKKNILYYSSIMKWFEEDFLVASASVLDYILTYVNPETKAYIESRTSEIRLRVMPYDWNLNRQ